MGIYGARTLALYLNTIRRPDSTCHDIYQLLVISERVQWSNEAYKTIDTNAWLHCAHRLTLATGNDEYDRLVCWAWNLVESESETDSSLRFARSSVLHLDTWLVTRQARGSIESNAHSDSEFMLNYRLPNNTERITRNAENSLVFSSEWSCLAKNGVKLGKIESLCVWSQKYRKSMLMTMMKMKIMMMMMMTETCRDERLTTDQLLSVFPLFLFEPLAFGTYLRASRFLRVLKL